MYVINGRLRTIQMWSQGLRKGGWQRFFSAVLGVDRTEYSIALCSFNACISVVRSTFFTQALIVRYPDCAEI